MEVPDKAIDTDASQVQISSVNWSSEGYGGYDDNSVPTEYLLDGGAMDAVSNNCEILLNYHPLPVPISIQTAANDSKAVIIGKVQLRIDSDEGYDVIIEDVYHCSKALQSSCRVLFYRQVLKWS